VRYPADPVHPVLAGVSVFFGALAGLVFGIGGFFIATVFPAMMRTALPGMTDTVYLGARTYIVPGAYDPGAATPPPARR